MNEQHTKVLVVEDEVLIADTLRRQLERRGYVVTDTVISFEEAVASVKRVLPDVVLLDIRLNGERSGIDFAAYLRGLPTTPQFIYLTSQMDDQHLERAQRTYPAAYLGKPIQLETLLATLKMLSFKTQSRQQGGQTLEVRQDNRVFRIELPEIRFIRVDHVYLSINLTNGREALQRGSIQDIIDLFGAHRLVRVHRSYAVNPEHVTGQDSSGIYCGKTHIPVSRRRRREVFQQLNLGST